MSHHSYEGFTPLDSDHLDGVKYNGMQRRLTVRFKNGYVYEVHGVTQEKYQDFMDAPSQGEHYHQIFKANHHIERVR